VTVECGTAIKILFLYFNLCLSVMLDSMSCSFTSISFLIKTQYIHENGLDQIFFLFRTLLQRHKILHADNIYIIFYNWNILENGVNHHHPNPNPYNTLHIKFLVLKKNLIQAIFMYILCLNKKGYGCKWTW
jgi:hypothetical protein